MTTKATSITDANLIPFLYSYRSIPSINNGGKLPGSFLLSAESLDQSGNECANFLVVVNNRSKRSCQHSHNCTLSAQSTDCTTTGIALSYWVFNGETRRTRFTPLCFLSLTPGAWTFMSRRHLIIHARWKPWCGFGDGESYDDFESATAATITREFIGLSDFIVGAHLIRIQIVQTERHIFQ